MTNETQFKDKAASAFLTLRLRHARSVPDLNNALRSQPKLVELRYKGAASQLIGFINQFSPKQGISVTKDNYYIRRKALAEKVLTTGSQLYILYDQLTGQHINKKQLTYDLYYCELLAGNTNPKWGAYLKDAETINTNSVRGFIRQTTAGTNWYRLYAIRLKKMFTNLMPLIKSIFYQRFIHGINAINTILNYLAWIFYLPRLVANLFVLAKHAIPGNWMPQAQQDVGFINRFNLHWSRLWFEILNDSVWCTVGLACCFLLSPANSILLTATLYFFDLLMSYANSIINIKHHQTLEQNLSSILQDLNQSLDQIKQTSTFSGAELQDELDSIKQYKVHVDSWLLYEQQKLNLSLQVTTGLAIAMAIGALPTLFILNATLTILCPLLSACTVVAICTYQYIKNNQIESSCPKSDIQELKNLEEQIAEQNNKPLNQELQTTQDQQIQNLPPKYTRRRKSQSSDNFFTTKKFKSRIVPSRNFSCPQDFLSQLT